MIKKTVALLLLVFLNGCASIINGQNQTLSVDTSPHKGASCYLVNDKGKWFISDTPGSVTVLRSYEDLIVTCEKDGLRGTTSVKSSTKGMAAGNILFGGFIGAAVDCGTGSAYDYPSIIHVDLK
jgi:uncharacterized protein YceK